MSTEKFKPYIAPSDSPAEFTPRAVLLGIFFGLFFGAVTVYLALKVGLTVSASIPIAVLSIVIFKVMGGSSILENNIVQTTGSAGESIAAGVVFTLPALVFLGFDPSYWRIVGIALAGGWLGVLFMIPLRRYLIVREHGALKYPEGTACAEVLIAGEKGGKMGLRVLQGLGLGFVYSWLMKVFGLWTGDPEYRFPKRVYDGASVAGEISPELLGVGYIIGFRISGIMVAGGVLAYLVFIPLIKMFGPYMTQGTNIFPGTMPIADMSPGDVRAAYVRYIGAGAVAAGGILNVIRAMPIIFDSLRSSIHEMRGGTPGGAVAGATRERTDIDMPITIVGGGSAIVIAFLWVMLQFFMNPGHAVANFGAAVLMVIFGFLFVTVSSRLVGEIGSSSNPISGMTIATLMATCLIFLAVGWTGGAYAAVALSIGAVVCIASANAGATSQDLKTGFLLGATPSRQQVGLMLGVTFSTLIIGGTMSFMDKAYTNTVPAASKSIDYVFPEEQISGTQPMTAAQIADLRTKTADERRAIESFVAGGGALIQKSMIGSDVLPDGLYLVDASDHRVRFVVERGIGSADLPAPQGQLMATVINGILTQKLPWNLILLGIFSALTLELAGVRSLPFAVGVYLPLSTTSPIFIGGLVKKLVDWKLGVKDEDESEASSGMLFSSGLIAGGALAGLAVAIVAMANWTEILDFGASLWGEHGRESGMGAFVGLLIFVGLSAVLYNVGKKKEEL